MANRQQQVVVPADGGVERISAVAVQCAFFLPGPGSRLFHG